MASLLLVLCVSTAPAQIELLSVCRVNGQLTGALCRERFVAVFISEGGCIHALIFGKIP